MQKLKPIKSFIQLKTLYQNEDYMITKDKMDSYTLFSKKGGIWDAYYLEDYNNFYNDEIGNESDLNSWGLIEAPTYILVKRNTSKWIVFDFEDKLKKFIEENCPYNFDIIITKTHTGVEISDNTDSTDGLSHSEIISELENISSLVDDIYFSPDPEDCDGGVLEGKSDVEDAIDDLIDKL